jgi:hypothetical protein
MSIALAMTPDAPHAPADTTAPMMPIFWSGIALLP